MKFRMTLRNGVLLALALPAGPILATVHSDVVAYGGMSLPGINQPLQGFAQYQAPVIDSNGVVSFIGITATSGGIWSGTPGNLSPTAITNSPINAVSGGVSGQFNGISWMDTEQAGPLAYVAKYTPTGGSALFGTFIHTAGGEELAASPAVPVPGGPAGATFTNPSQIAVNSTGQFSFPDQLSTDGSAGVGIYANTDGNLRLIAHSGSPLPGLPGVMLNNGYSYVATMPNGSVTFFGALSNGTGLVNSDGTNSTIIAESNQAVPGLAGQHFGTIQNQQVHPNANGDIAFYDGSIWLKSSSGFKQVAKVGTPVVGGGRLSTVYNDPHVANDDRVIFNAEQTNGVSGLYYADTTGVHPIMTTGTSAPGLPSNWTVNRVYSAEVNGRGQAAFIADLTAPGGGPEYNYLFATDPDGSVEYIGGPGTTLALPTYTFTAGAADIYSRDFTDVERTQFNDNGDLVYTLGSFSGSPTVVMVAHVVPEPSTLAIAATAGAVLMCHARRKRTV